MLSTSRASSDIALIQGFLLFLPIGLANIVMFVVSLAIMFWLSPLLASVMLVVGPVLGFTALRLRTSVFPASWDAQQRAGDVANVVEEAVTGVRVVKGFGQERATVFAAVAAVAEFEVAIDLHGQCESRTRRRDWGR